MIWAPRPVALLAPLPYTLSRLMWAGGIDAGLSPALATELRTPGSMSVYLVFLAALAEAPGILVHTVVAPRRERVPARVPLAGGRRIRPGMVVAPLVLLGVAPGTGGRDARVPPPHEATSDARRAPSADTDRRSGRGDAVLTCARTQEPWRNEK